MTGSTAALQVVPVAVGERPHAVADLDTMEVLARAQAGDSEAFGELYDRYVDIVSRYVGARVGSRALAEDLTSETFLRALRRIDSFTWQGRDLGSWLVTIARNLVADHYSSSRVRREVVTGDVVEVGAGQRVDGPEDSVVSRLDARALRAAVERLAPEQRECVRLRFLSEMSVRETAEAMNRNDGAVRALQYRALRSLAALLPQELLAS